LNTSEGWWIALPPKHFLEFDHFRIDPEERVLTSDGKPIALSPKAFDTLLVLAQRCQRVVLKEDLMKSLWPDTFVEESNLSQHIFQLRKALGENAQDPQYIVTVPGRGYRFSRKVVELSADAGDLVVQSRSIQTLTVEETESTQFVTGMFLILRQRLWTWVLSAFAIVVLVAVALVVRARRPPPLNEADLVLVADFVNTTGEPVFDSTLKQALSVKLAESPFFNIVPDSTTRKTLGLMARSADERVVPSIAREVCQRENAQAVVGGSIVSLGSKYVLDLDTIDCLTGASLAHQEIEALNRDQVLTQLGKVIPPLRRRLGESVSSIQKFDTPIEQATTKSLAALKAFTAGDQKRAQGGEADSVPFYKMAIELDPDFAIAYARLGTVYGNLNQMDLSDQYLQQAFQRREHVSEREKFDIQAHYYEDTTREIDKANETYKLWSEVYPHDFLPLDSLASGYILVGQFEKAIAAGQQALKVNPNHALAYASLGRAYERATRFAEARVICNRAVTEKVDSSWTHQVLYRIAFVEGDESAMQREMAWFRGKPQESVALYFQGKAALSQGELRKAREIFERARALAVQQGRKEVAVAFFNGQAQFEADLGNARDVPALADQVLRSSPNSGRHKAFATLALARAGDVKRVDGLMKELNKQPMAGTGLTEVVFPSIRAAVDLNRRNPAAAIEELRRAVPYDLGTDSGGITLYYRGLAYLELKSGKEAEAQFQKILDNRGVVMTDIYWPLARLGMARSLAQTGDTEKSLAQYREFLTLWKNADPDLRILNEAKAEYKKISGRSPPSL
jgi:DNA-binding winged helix-turn-helix (wHTH) protein/tetratricopeptide (TPR) repeat protein